MQSIVEYHFSFYINKKSEAFYCLLSVNNYFFIKITYYQ